MSDIFFQLSFVLAIAALLGLLTQRLRQPLILAYILTGFLIGFLGLTKITDSEIFRFFSSTGIAFLLFLAGIEISLSGLKEISKIAFWTAGLQVIGTLVLGLVLVLALGFNFQTAFLLSLALTFSSTIIVIKLLSEKQDLDSLHGRISMGILIFQDLVAILALVLVASYVPGVTLGKNLLWLLTIGAKGALFFFIALLFANKILPKILKLSASSGELLFLVSLSWAFVLASIGKFLGFTFEIGAFLAGLTIATSPYRFAISARVRPLRDFFLILFFVVLGFELTLTSGLPNIFLVFLISAFVLIVKPLVILFFLGFFGHKKRTSFLTALSLAQISEFSLILLVTAQNNGFVGHEVISLTAMVALVSIAVSSYLILHAAKIYRVAVGYLSIFERKKTRATELKSKVFEISNHVVLVGCDRAGQDILRLLKEKATQNGNWRYLVVDFNPEVVKRLLNDGIPSLYGDIADPEILEELNLKKARLLISTCRDLEDNLILLSEAKKEGFGGSTVMTASYPQEAIKLYEAGASYVLLPQLLGGQHLSLLLERHWDDLSYFTSAREYHLSELLEKT